jgi:hypothetical protein
VRCSCGDVRDHIVSHKNDHRPPYRSYRALQRRKSLKIDIREIFGVARFSTFATVSATSRRWPKMPSRAANGGDQNVREDVAIALRDVRQHASCGQRYSGMPTIRNASVYR